MYVCQAGHPFRDPGGGLGFSPAGNGPDPGGLF
jgi:hypothetical protein